MRGNISYLIFFAFFLLSLVACNINRFYVEDSITLRVKESLYIDNSCVLCPVFVHENIDGANSANLLKNELKLKYEETKLDDFTLVSTFVSNVGFSGFFSSFPHDAKERAAISAIINVIFFIMDILYS